MQLGYSILLLALDRSSTACGFRRSRPSIGQMPERVPLDLSAGTNSDDANAALDADAGAERG